MHLRGGAVLRAVLGSAAVVAVTLALIDGWDRSRGLELPGWPTSLAAAALISGGLVCGAKGWLYVLDRRRSRRLAETFYLSQLGKYLPGAIWQPAGQLAMAVGAGVPGPVAATAVPVYMLTLVAAGATLGLGLTVFATDLPLVLRLLPLLGLGPVALLRRRWMVSVLDRLHGRFERIPGGEVVPAQTAITTGYLWGLGVMLLTGAAFFALARAFDIDVSPVVTVSAFSFAWTVGFLALPVPAGLGVREGLLVALLGSGLPTGAVLAAAVVYRLLSIVVEVAVVILSRLAARRRSLTE